MTPTTDDLKHRLAQVSAEPPVVGDLAERAARRGRTIRRRRSGVVVVAVAVAVAGLVLPNLPGRTAPPPPSDQPTPTPTVTADGDVPLPEYLRGGTLVASKEETDAKGITLVFTPTSLDFGLVYSCAGEHFSTSTFPAAVKAMPLLSIKGVPYASTGCGQSLGLSGDGDMGRVKGLDWAAEYGLKAGVPAEVRFEFPDPHRYDGTRFRIGVYQAVPLDEYPFPDRPEVLLPDFDAFNALLPRYGGPRLVFSGAHPSDPTGFTYTVPVSKGLRVVLQTVAPGTFRLFADDRLVATQYSWTYDSESHEFSVSLSDLGIASGDQVAIRFEVDRFPPGTYRFAVYDSRR